MITQEGPDRQLSGDRPLLPSPATARAAAQPANIRALAASTSAY